jgi:hypothetical protein
MPLGITGIMAANGGAMDPLDPVVRLDDFLRQAHSGDLNAPDQIRELIAHHPDLAVHAGDLAGHAEQTLVEFISMRDPLAIACLKAKLTQLRDELSAAKGSPVLQLLADRIVVDWLFLHLLDVLCSHVEHQSGGASKVLGKKRETAHRLYRSSLKLYQVFRKSLEQRPAVKREPHSPAVADARE